MMRSIIHSVCVIFISLFVSCTNRDKTDFKSTKVDFSEITHINQSDGRIVKLETTDNSLIYDICNLNVHQDTFVVHSFTQLLVHIHINRKFHRQYITKRTRHE